MRSLPFTYCPYKKSDDDPCTGSKRVAYHFKQNNRFVQTEHVFVSNDSVSTTSEKIIWYLVVLGCFHLLSLCAKFLNFYSEDILCNLYKIHKLIYNRNAGGTLRYILNKANGYLVSATAEVSGQQTEIWSHMFTFCLMYSYVPCPINCLSALR
jgi:hypothetical protein